MKHLEEVCLEIRRRALPYLQTRKNDIHTRISFEFASQLLAEKGGDPSVVLPAVLLHDVGWSQVPEHLQLTAFGPNPENPQLRDVHEREGARIAGEILREVDCPVETTQRIVEIVAVHDSGAESRSIEESMVKDADKLFRVSSEGFRIDCARFGVDPDRYLSWLEAQIEVWFFTDNAKRLARQEVDGRRRELGAQSGEGVAPVGEGV